MDWLSFLHQRLHATPAVVRVVVVRVRGSAPREAGACMLVDAAGAHGTIGGGHLEHVAMATARDMLAATAPPRVDRFSLGASLGQCCGGIVELAFVRYGADDLAYLDEALQLRRTQPSALLLTALGDRAFVEPLAHEVTDLWIFGAGHVGRALVATLQDLPFRITSVDSREGVACTLQVDDPARAATSMPGGAWALVMTHSHDEDYAICEALLRRDQATWIGLIGSAPKAKRFRQRLSQRGFSEADIARITTPVGIGTIASKEPAAIAISVAAQLLQLREARASAVAGESRTA